MGRLIDAICQMVSIVEEQLPRKYFEELDNAGAEIIDCLEKLRHYEQLEEQGLLLQLPCKVGDKVWIIDGQCLSDDECWELNGCENCNLYEAYVTEVTFNVDFYDWMGKTVFLTKEEAEKALAEMEKKNGKIT